MRWGIIGYGWVARDYMAPAIAEAGGTLTAIADPSPEVRGRAPAGVAAFAKAAELAASGLCDLVYVATPNHAHAEPVAAAAAAGLPVLCEKPIAATLEQAEAVAAAVEGAGVLYGTAYDQRHHPAHRALRQAILDGSIGRPVAVRIVYACWVGPGWRPCEGANDNWRADPDRAGGGAVMDLAPHGLDLAEMLLGEPLETLSITLQRRLHDYPVDDGGISAGRSASGVLFQAHVAYNCAEVLPRRRLEVLGENGLITAIDTMGQSAGGTLTRQCGRSGAFEALLFDTRQSPFAAQAAAFMAAARGEAHDFDLARDMRLTRLFHAAHKEALACL